MGSDASRCQLPQPHVDAERRQTLPEAMAGVCDLGRRCLAVQPPGGLPLAHFVRQDGDDQPMTGLAEKIAPADRRMDVLTPTHHMAVAKLAPPEQREWLSKAADGDGEKPWPVARLKREIKHADGEVSPLTFGITVFCNDEADQQAGCRQLDNLGRRYKTFVSGSKE